MADFSSDATAGVAPAVLEAIVAASAGPVRSYGADEWTARAVEQLAKTFETELSAFLVSNGTAANALAIAHITPPWGTILAHEQAHVAIAECNAVEHAAGGAKVVGLPGEHGRIAPDVLAAYLERTRSGAPGRPRPTVLSLTQCTDLGGVYAVHEITTLSRIAHDAGLLVHLDGARLPTALAAAGARPAEMTWRAGVDVLSFGSSKGGTMNAEAVIFFDPARAAGFDLRLRQSGHAIAKSRFLGAQMLAWLEGGRWLALAEHANRMARQVADGLEARGAKLYYPPTANLVFATLPCRLAKDFAQRGIRYAGPAHRPRFVTSWATSDEDIALLREPA